jgi:guanosine-3',5'-bis(diphosphate) 3'-pyrophosphohydrolase
MIHCARREVLTHASMGAMDSYRDMLLAHMGIAHLPERVECALSIACDAHRGVLRKSGEEYINHPVEVAMLCFDVIGLDEVTICAALLHDVVEDSEWTEAQVAEGCGQDVADVVIGVTKLSRLDFPSREAAQIESYRRMIIAMARDIRVIIVKLCDRLHNMRTIGAQSDASRQRIASETLNMYAPIAHRLGIQRIKAELEDRSFEILDPEAYARVSALVEQTQIDRLTRIDQVSHELQKFLASHEVVADVSGRVKHLYSVYRKGAGVRSDHRHRSCAGARGHAE